MIITSSLLEDVAILFAVIIVTLTVFMKWSYTYWSRVGLEYVEPTFPFGNFWNTVRYKMTLGKEMQQYYLDMKSKGAKHVGLYLFYVPAYLPIDQEVLKHILKVDFNNFEDRGVYHNAKTDPLSEHLISMKGMKWRNLRSKVSTTFTSSKMKMIFPLIVKICEQMTSFLDSRLSNEPVDFKNLFQRLTVDIVINCAFGIDVNSVCGPESEFGIEGKKYFRRSLWQKLIVFLCMLHPNAMRFLGMRFTPKSTEICFLNAIRDIIKYREENNVTRNDLMQLLINMKNVGVALPDDNDAEEMKLPKKSTTGKITESEIAGVCFGHFAAGYETSSSALTFCLYEVAQNETIQKKMRNEIHTVLSTHNGEITYEAMMEMKYMDNVICESLRKYPPIPFGLRRCTGDSKIPNTNVILKKGDIVIIPIECVLNDPEYYPDPNVFDPDRFTEENKLTRPPLSFIPFGEGPRMCVAYRFGIMQIKIGLITLFKDYKFKLNPKTPVPLLLDPKELFNSAAGDILIDVDKLTQEDV